MSAFECIEVEGAGLAEHWEYGAVGSEVVTGVGKAVGSPPTAQPDAVHTPASDTGILQGQGLVAVGQGLLEQDSVVLGLEELLSVE